MSDNADGSVVVRHIDSAEEALQAARDLAATWARTAEELDRERRIPRREMRALEASGLLGITIPRQHGGAGLGAEVLVRIFRILAAADTALAQIPQNHFDFVDTLASAGRQTQAFFYPRVLAGARFGNAIAERGRRSRRDLATTIVEEADGYRIDGTKAFCTGALTAAWVPVHAMHADGRIRTAYVARDAEGLDVKLDWDAFGQRATFSGTATLEKVFVPRERVVDRTLDQPEFLLAQFAGNQLIHAAIEVGAAEGALDRAVAIAVQGGRSTRDLERIGFWEVELQAARALTDRAARLVDEALGVNPTPRVDAIAAAIAVDEAKSLAYILGPGLAGDLSAFAGATAKAQNGIDRYWRNSRTHALHDPVRWRQFYVGNYHLNKQLAPDLAARFSEEAVP
jgi:alkylation response protein AidB-like acyl-CoA dehydrogenase